MAERPWSEPTTLRRSLVMASGNPGKLRELTHLLQPLGWDIRPQGEWDLTEAVEDGQTFIENALIKARHAAHGTKLPSLGDDSGLVVDALGGVPGIYSSRYAGVKADAEANNNKLLEAMRDVPDSQRSAHFYCALALLRHASDPSPLIATGIWHGSVIDAPRGTGGFGYDPLFWVSSHTCTSAELDSATKNRISHRGQALAALVEQLRCEQLD